MLRLYTGPASWGASGKLERVPSRWHSPTMRSSRMIRSPHQADRVTKVSDRSKDLADDFLRSSRLRSHGLRVIVRRLGIHHTDVEQPADHSVTHAGSARWHYVDVSISSR